MMSIMSSWPYVMALMHNCSFKQLLTLVCHAQASQEEFDSERSDLTSSHNRQKKEMADLMAAMEAEFAEADSEARQEFEAAREEIRNR